MSIVHRQDDEMEINLLELLQLLLRRAQVIIICTLLFGLIAYAGTCFLITPQYQASTTLYVNNSVTRENSTTISQNDLNASTHLVDTYSAIIKSRTLLTEVIEKAGVDIKVDELQDQITTSSLNDTEVFRVFVQNPDPRAAARIANAIAEVAPDQIADIVEGSSVKIVDYAEIPTKIASPNYRRNAVIGMMMGMVLSAAVIVFRAMLDTSIRSEADFSQWEYPILSTIPDLDEARKKKNRGYGYGYDQRN